MNEHFNSRKITIKRLQPFNHEAQQGLDDWFANANQAIGSYFKAGGSKRVETGLDDWEADELLPLMVNAESDDRDFKTKVEAFFVDINTRIPHDGLELEIGLKKDNSKGIVFKEGDKPLKNYPISIEDYIIYRHCLKYPFLAPSKDEGESNPLIRFYVEDKSKESSKLVASESLKDDAMLKYLNISKEPKKVNMYLALLGKDYRKIATDERPIALKSIVINKPKSFIEIIEDKDAPIKFFVSRLVSAEVVIKEGDRYLYGGEQLAISLTDFVLFLQDKVNSETLGIMKAKLAELSTK